MFEVGRDISEYCNEISVKLNNTGKYKYRTFYIFLEDVSDIFETLRVIYYNLKYRSYLSDCVITTVLFISENAHISKEHILFNPEFGRYRLDFISKSILISRLKEGFDKRCYLKNGTFFIVDDSLNLVYYDKKLDKLVHNTFSGKLKEEFLYNVFNNSEFVNLLSYSDIFNFIGL